MIFDSLILAAVTNELTGTITGGKVERIAQPMPLEVVLTIYHAGAKHYLLLSCDAQAARAHLTFIRRDNPPHPPPFCMLLRKYLEGAWVEAVTMPLGFGERVLHIQFRAVDGAVYTLIAEIMGKHSNIILVNKPGTILGAAKPITRAVNRFREVLPGLPYAPPPRQRSKSDPLRPVDITKTIPPQPGQEAEWLLATFTGISPLLAREAVLRARPPLTAETLWYGLNEILNLARVADYAPRLWSDEHGQTQGAYPIPLLSIPLAQQYARDSISLSLDTAAASLALHNTFDHAQETIITALHRTRKAREHEQEEIRQGLVNAARAEEYQQSAELLLAHQHAIARGNSEVSLPDYYAPLGDMGQPAQRTIALDPKMDAHANAERYLKKARKARDSGDTLQARQAVLEEEIAALTLAEPEAAAATTMAQIAAIRERLADILMRGAHAPAGTGEEKERQRPGFDGHKIRTFRSPDGWEILVGENATANDYLTTKVASSSDIWLHVRAATSAHGVIRAQNRPAAVSPAALQQAAELVAARSEVKHSSLIPVDYTLKKYVRKPRRSAPGAVTYQNEKTLYVAGING